MIVYRASSLGACTKRLIAERFGYEPAPTPEKMRAVFARGNEIEDVVLSRLREQGEKVVREQEEVILPITAEIAVVGHIDAVIQYPARLDEVMHKPGPRLLEIKSMDEPSFRAWVERGWDAGTLLLERYKWQVSAYMLATGLECTLWGEKNDLEATHLITIEEPFYSLAEIRTRVLLVEAAARSAEIPVECDTRSYPCPFFYLHDDEKDYDEDEEIDALGKAYQAARDRERLARSTLDGLRGRLDESVGQRTQVDTGTVRVSRVTTTRRNLDRDAIQKAGISLTEFERTTTTQSIRVTVREEDAAQGQPRAGANPTDGAVGGGEE